MSSFLDNARELAQTLVEKINRVINPPLSSDARPLDLQQAILEAIEARTQPAGGGRRQMPDGYVGVRIVAKDPAEERAMRAALDGIRELAATRLRELQCRVPQSFRIDVAYVRRRPASWTPDQPLAIEFEAAAPAPAGAGPQPADAAQPDLILTIVRGRASADSYTLREPAVRVGRSEAPVDDRGRARLNHVAFTEDDDAHSRTVGRGHCEIRYDRAGGEYRIFDERSANGTRIVRDGHVIEVPAQDPFGIAIRSGDELQFGTAAARVEIRPPA
jgi:pSer/pThr/pTyr-binding forkhead associated (FHA) protein